MNFKFNKKYRICLKKDIINLFKGKTLSCHFLKISYKKNNLNFSRILIKIKKSICCAVLRNKLKRKTREFFRLNKNIISNGYDICFIYKKNYILEDDILLLLKKAGLINL